jgi:hypothetical protein
VRLEKMIRKNLADLGYAMQKEKAPHEAGI